MPWVYLSDSFPDHPKVVEAEDIHEHAPWLFICGLAYCRKHLTGGMIRASQVRCLVRSYSPRMAEALVAAGLWDEIKLPDQKKASAYQVHDYDVWNETEDHQREARSEKARKAAEARWAARDAANA